MKGRPSTCSWRLLLFRVTKVEGLGRVPVPLIVVGPAYRDEQDDDVVVVVVDVVVVVVVVVVVGRVVVVVVVVVGAVVGGGVLVIEAVSIAYWPAMSLRTFVRPRETVLDGVMLVTVFVLLFVTTGRGISRVLWATSSRLRLTLSMCMSSLHTFRCYCTQSVNVQQSTRLSGWVAKGTDSVSSYLTLEEASAGVSDAFLRQCRGAACP